jgi:hypothetical protein
LSLEDVMKRLLVLALVTAMVVPALPLTAAGRIPARAGQAQTGAIQGTATSSTGQTLPNFTVQVRNLQTGQLAGSTTSNAAGSFNFAGLAPGNYVVEVVNQAGTIVGSSSAIAVTAGATVTVAVSTTAAAAIAGAGGAAAGGAAATTAGVSTAVIVTTVAAAAGIAGAVAIAVNNDSSPSR